MVAIAWTVKLSLAVAILGLLCLLVCPKEWIAASGSGAKSMRRMGLPPWRYLNTAGKLAYLALCGAGTMFFLSLLAAGWLEKH